MKKGLLFPALFLFAGLYTAQAQKIASYNADDLVARTANKDTLYIVNFWATWCVPCVKELPSFNMVHDLYKDKPVKVLLVSFDFKEQYPAKLQSWVSKKKLRPEVAWFNETNPTSYIPKIAPEWEGGLPATLFINNKTGERKLHADEISVDELKSWVDKQL
ncbi:TlpA disulfide reductase family protein [Taibaiella koreensis]|uniref:TlpA disulfide reductase family protein n=1 Tax=Taibaiella koreensis TaxID=1268548 RepID=UPI000E5993AC|nr:TlpA disulfide reductase family protein [Taibaiella koreensis]